MALQTAALDQAAEGVALVAAFMSLHTAAAGGSGANEVSGSGYARQAVTWNPASGTVVAADVPIAFTGPASQEIAEVGLWTAVSGGTWLGSEVPTGDLAFNGSGEVNVTTATLTAAAG